ncbi:MAG: hypothetical protein AB7V43_02315 [Acidimicrobiia bacterium]
MGSAKQAELIEALRTSPLLAALANGHPFTVGSDAGPWTDASGALAGMAAHIHFDEVVTLAGRPIIDSPDAVSEEQQASGATAPGPAVTRYCIDSSPATADSFSVLIDLSGQIRNVINAPPAAPSAPPAPSTPATIPTGEPATDMILALDAPLLKARSVSDETFDGPHATLAPDGSIIASRKVDGHFELFSLSDGKTPADTGLNVAEGALVRFGPTGDLLVLDYGTADSDAVVRQFRRGSDGRFVAVKQVSGAITGECVLTVDATYAGCRPETGPHIAFDPPLPFDQVRGDPTLAGTRGTGVVERTGSSSAQWHVSLKAAIEIDCTDDACAGEWYPGPNGSAVYAPFLRTPGGGNHLVAFVLDDRTTARGARLDPCDRVLGVVGNELIGVQDVSGSNRIVAFDLTPLLH